MSKKHRHSNLLARVNFPLYTIQLLTNRHILVGGGGGAANTGVANGFEVFELLYDGKRFISKEAVRFETGSKVVMNCAVYWNSKRTYLVAGQDNCCQLYQTRFNISKETPLKDSSSKSDKDATFEPSSNFVKSLQISFQPVASVCTDYSENEPFQRVVRISQGGKLVATGGSDGIVTVWKFPSFEQVVRIMAHTKEVDDLDFSPDEKQIVSVSKDTTGVVWCSKTGDKVQTLETVVPSQNGTKYCFKRCRFTRIEDQGLSRLYTIMNPLGRPGKKNSYIQMWDPAGGNLIRQISYKESLSALAVRNDGRFVAVGTMFTGTVIVLAAFSLQKVLRVQEAHSMFITGLEFVPVCQDLRNSITTDSEAAVLSISVDNKICIHSVPYRRTIPLWLFSVMMVVTILFSFFFCEYFEL